VGALPVRLWNRLLITQFLLLLSLFLNSKSDFWVAGDVARRLRSFVGGLRAWCHPGVFAADGRAPGGVGMGDTKREAGVGSADDAGVGGADDADAGGTNDAGTGEANDTGVRGTNDACIGWERHFPFTGGGACSGRTVTTDALLSVNNIDTDGIEPRPDDTIGGPCLDLMVRSSIPSMPGGTTPGDVVSVPGFLGVVDPGVTGLGSPGYADSLSLPVN
jgi:hypothetical protein